ncbi:unnamed protein product [Sphacelaria rigidula]
MHDNGIPETISPSGKIKVYSSKTSSPINKALIEEAATELFDEDQAARLVKHIEEKRGVTEKIKLKRVAAPSKKAVPNKKKKSGKTPV